MKKKKVGLLSSIKTKLSVLVVLAIIVTGVLMVFTYSPKIKEELTNMSQNYLNDLATAYGDVIAEEVALVGPSSTLTVDNLTPILEGGWIKWDFIQLCICGSGGWNYDVASAAG